MEILAGLGMGKCRPHVYTDAQCYNYHALTIQFDLPTVRPLYTCRLPVRVGSGFSGIPGGGLLPQNVKLPLPPQTTRFFSVHVAT